MKNKLLFILFCVVNLFSQVDTTIYYPLHVGDKWEYQNLFSPGGNIVEITGDTVMPNGYKYYIFSFTDRKYQRVDSNNNVMFYSEWSGAEHIRFNLDAKKGEIELSFADSTFGFGVYDEKIY